MSVIGSDFLNLAQQQLAESSTEIEYRNVVSLAYYSSYHALKPHLSRNAPNTHSALIDYLCEESEHKGEKISSSDLRSLGLLLEVMKKDRVYADYFLNKTIKSRDAVRGVASANAFQKALDAVLDKAPQKQQA